ncbi:putative glycosyltransferase EpsF [Sporotomaculum syntrophicum]|uniref:Glycosyltransferase EpsF n=1 Tax=Sporotomaculum syntrophicum TaxID=182264 RepID=A0A9D2WT12_9FIRM|nr:glycosyltransferase family 1 protein [Sporotomaculum syntrophicum]KAF1086092.1 putative glycosyltransferase EpsF [Sporotomaculum syntrophicum]
MKRVLIISNTMDAGGAETFLMKVYRYIDRNVLQFDFLVNRPGRNFYEDEIFALGGRMYRGFSKSRYPVKSFNRIRRLVKFGCYDAVLLVAVHPVAWLDLLAARMGGAKIRLVRSTNSSSGGGSVANLLAVLSRPLVRTLATGMLAPSDQAAGWLFGDKAVKEGRVTIITNGLPLEQYRFDPDIRARVRDELGCKDAFVVGHIGRFNKQKNHSYLIEVFAQLVSRCEKACLMLVGTGELEGSIQELVRKKGLAERVLFLGVRSDVPRLLMAMDELILPSLYEGMPNVVVEAQATGLPCLISDTITKEVVLTDLVQRLPLAENKSIWVKESLALGVHDRGCYTRILEVKGYHIQKTAEQVTAMLLDG